MVRLARFANWDLAIRLAITLVILTGLGLFGLWRWLAVDLPIAGPLCTSEQPPRPRASTTGTGACCTKSSIPHGGAHTPIALDDSAAGLRQGHRRHRGCQFLQ